MLDRRTLQRALRHNPQELGALTYDEEAEGTQKTLNALVAAVLQAAPGLSSKSAEVRAKLGEYADDDPPDLAYDSAESVVKWLAEEGIEADEEEGGQDEVKAEESSESHEPEGQTVGKLFFPGDTYHKTVKKAVIAGIGKKKLSVLVYGDNTHHNFNFWFEKDGSIYADVNSDRNSKGKDTGYRWDGKTAVKR